MLRNLTLQRPLAAIDVETTGLLEDGCRVVELAIVKIQPDGGLVAYAQRLNPGIPIPPLATAIHGIGDAQVAGCPAFLNVAEMVLDMLQGCDLTGFNIQRFDIPVIGAELIRAGPLSLKTAGRHVLDVMEMFHKTLPVNQYGRPARGTGTLKAACHRYLGGPFPGAHGALIDALAALQVLDAMVRYHRLPATIAELVEASASLAFPNPEEQPR